MAQTCKTSEIAKYKVLKARRDNRLAVPYNYFKTTN